MNAKQSIDLVRDEANECSDVEVAQDKYNSYLSAIQALHIWEDRILQLTKEKALKCNDISIAEKYLSNATQVATIWKDRVRELACSNKRQNSVKCADVEPAQENLLLLITTGSDIREMRMALGFTVSEFANVLKVPPGTLGSWESRQRLSKTAKAILVEYARTHESQLKDLGALWKELQLKQLKFK